MADIKEKRYLDEEGLKKVFKSISDSIPDNALLGIINTVMISANNNEFSIKEMENNSQRHIIFVHNGTEDNYTITIPTTYKTPDGEEIILTIPKGGFAEVNFVKIGNEIYARGL